MSLRGLGTRCAVAALAAATACRPAASPPPNVVLIVVDTLRADRLGCYGSSARLTPFIDSLAARGAVFRHAYAQSSHTKPSVASLMTSRFAWQHGVGTPQSVLEDDETTLAEVFRAHRYATGGFSASKVVGVQDGFGQGFDLYAAYPPRRPDGGGSSTPVRAEFLEHAAEKWIRGVRHARAEAPLFIYLHLMEVHPAYAPPPDAVAARLGITSDRLGAANASYFGGGAARGNRADLAGIAQVYDAEVASVDEALRHFFAALDRLRVLNRSVVVLTADHGEGFYEHRLFGHGNSLYEELVHVPLLLVRSDADGPRAVDRAVSLIDVAPTLLELAGIPIPPSFEGRSLASANGGSALAYAELLRDDVEVDHTRAVILDRRKAIARRDGTVELYDLLADPGESVPWQSASKERATLERALAGATARAGTRVRKTATRRLDPDTSRQLRALGYVE